MALTEDHYARSRAVVERMQRTGEDLDTAIAAVERENPHLKPDRLSQKVRRRGRVSTHYPDGPDAA